MGISLKTVGMVVKDMVATLDFYRALGLAIPPEISDVTNYEFETKDGVVLGFLSESMAKLSDTQFVTPVGQAMNLHFACDTPAEVDERYTSLVRAGYTGYAEPWNAFWGQRFGRILDPDGRIVNIYADTRPSPQGARAR